jgi:glycosyltransferase involved in cell wall biosynthesis
MRIAQIAPLYESVPPRLYGGTERVVSYLTEELVAQGHEVTLFASGDSQTSARLIPARREALRLDGSCVDQLACHYSMLENVIERAHEFDILHFHVDYLHFPFSKRCAVPHLTTLHGRLNIPELAPLHRAFPEAPLVSISMSQRKPLPWANWIGNVYHGLPSPTSAAGSGGGNYLAFIGRIAREKRVDRAVQIAVNPACLSGSRPRSIRATGSTTKRKSSLFCTIRWSNTSAKSAKNRNLLSWAMPARRFSRSTGPNLSACA